MRERETRTRKYVNVQVNVQWKIRRGQDNGLQGFLHLGQ